MNTDLEGQVFHDRFRIKQVLGRGGMGVVYRAEQLSLGMDVALKVLPLSEAKSEVHVARFFREALVCSKLTHPNTIRIIDYGEASTGDLFLAMELLEGRTVADVLLQERCFAPARAAHIAIQVAKSISEAHHRGLIHRDLKPANIFLCDYHGEKDFVKVLDFGIAKFTDDAPRGDVELTQTGSIVGTPKYMSPEQGLSRPISPQTDLYSLGVVLYHMLCGAPPFIASEALAIIAMHLREPPPPFRTRCPQLELPADFEALIFQLLAKNPAERPSSAAEVVERLQAIQQRGSLPRFPVRPLTDPFTALPETHNDFAFNHTPSSLDYPGDADLDLAAFAVDEANQDDLDLGAFSLDDPTTADPGDDLDLTAFASAPSPTPAGSTPAVSAPAASDPAASAPATRSAGPATRGAVPAPAALPPLRPSDELLSLPSLPPIPSRSPESLPPASRPPRGPSRELLIALAAGGLIVISLLVWWITSQLQP